MRTRTILAAILGFAQPHYMADLSTSAVDLPIATGDHDAAAAPASDTGESSGGASAAADVRESDTSSSAAPALLSSDTAAAGVPQGDAEGERTDGAVNALNAGAAPSDASLIGTQTSSALSPTADPLPSVSIDVEDHAEACERFAGLLARLHGAEEDFVHALRNELNAIGTLLHLHTVASGKADATGDYSSSDLS
ncbi:hypothetical protein NX868_10295 [Burkholderia thailandensis]|uniref:hypothetical protein n=1 Tax=Burkholderia thailandensis TaxID=57975 RepID=UPI00217F060D|nr:hypothetical protein [Burkholderia thailandensis]MCS6455951.1 hypothetical protein [Burkholderia thailandensis]MCS6482666.1 hypothetical protein [Burkholderia thailandensis]